MKKKNVTNIAQRTAIPIDTKPKNKKPKILLIVIIAILCVVILIAATLGGLYYYFDNKSTEILQSTAPSLSNKIFVAEIENYYNVSDESDSDSADDDDLKYNSVLFFSDVQDENGTYTVSAHYYIAAYNEDGTPSYSNFSDCGDDIYDGDSYCDAYFDIATDLKGNITLNDEEYQVPIYRITTDENNNIITLTDEMALYQLSDDESIKTDIDKFLNFQDRYNNLDEFMTSFLTSKYNGYDHSTFGYTTWDTAIKAVFYDEPEVIVAPYDYTNDDGETLEGYKITMTGTYCPNAAQLKGVYSEEGTLEIVVDPNDLSNIYVLSGANILEAFDVYVLVSASNSIY